MKASASIARRRSSGDELRRARAGGEIRNGSRRVQTPRDPGERGGPGDRIRRDAQLAPKPIVERGFLPRRARAERFEVDAIFPVEAARDVDEDVERRGGRHVAQRERDLAPHAGVGIARETRGRRQHVEAAAPHGAVGRDLHGRVLLRFRRAGALTPLGPELIQQIEAAAAHERIRIAEQRRHGVDGRRAAGLEPFQADRAHVHRRRAQRRDQTLDRRRVERRRLRDESLRRNPVDGARGRVVEIGVPPDTRIDPVADVQRAVGTDRDVRRTEQRFGRPFRRPAAADEIRSGVRTLRVRRQEDLPLAEIEPGAAAHRAIGKDFVASRFGGEKRAVVRRRQARRSRRTRCPSAIRRHRRRRPGRRRDRPAAIRRLLPPALGGGPPASPADRRATRSRSSRTPSPR